jgi:hypothetical protein
MGLRIGRIGRGINQMFCGWLALEVRLRVIVASKQGEFAGFASGLNPIYRARMKH